MAGMMETLTERHAHEVMEMMMAGGKTYDRESLAAEIRSTFGMETRFHTCSLTGLTPEALIDFLEMRGKLSGPPEAFYFDPGNRCSH